MKAYKETVRHYYKYDTSNPIYNILTTGSLTNTNGVLSGFSTNNYAKYPEAINVGTSTWKKVWKFTTNSTATSSSQVVENSSACILICTGSGYLRAGLGNGSSWTIANYNNNVAPVANNTEYVFEIEFTGTQYIITINGNVAQTINSSNTIGSITANTHIGNNQADSSSPWLGNIDLTGSYMEVNNNKIWEGRTYPIIEGTSSDYDFYEDTETYNLYKGIVRHYYKYVNTPWTQPVLSANGTMGGNSFACAASSSDYAPWHAFDGSKTSSNRWAASTSTPPQWLTFYNPEKIKVTNLAITQRSDTTDHITSGIVQGSDDNTNWTDIKNFTNNNATPGATWNIDLSENTTSYKYYRIYITGYSASQGTYIHIVEVEITAFTVSVTEGTPSDYDFYEDTEEYQAFNV